MLIRFYKFISGTEKDPISYRKWKMLIRRSHRAGAGAGAGQGQGALQMRLLFKFTNYYIGPKR